MTIGDVETGGVRENQFSFMHLEFETPVGYLSGEAQHAVGYMGLKLKSYVRDDQKNIMKVVWMLVVLKTVTVYGHVV